CASAAPSSSASGRSCIGSALPDHRQEVPLRLTGAPADRRALERADGTGKVRVSLDEADHAPAHVPEHLPEPQLLAGDLAAARGGVGRQQLVARAEAAGRPVIGAEPPGANAQPAEVLSGIPAVAQLP